MQSKQNGFHALLVWNQSWLDLHGYCQHLTVHAYIPLLKDFQDLGCRWACIGALMCYVHANMQSALPEAPLRSSAIKFLCRSTPAHVDGHAKRGRLHIHKFGGSCMHACKCFCIGWSCEAKEVVIKPAEQGRCGVHAGITIGRLTLRTC